VSLLPLRPYQREAVDAVEASWAAGMRRPAVVLPTGAGKTVVFAHLTADRYRRQGGGKRTLVVAHRNELIEQAAAKISAVAPDLRVGIVKAARNETRAQIVVASIQTLRNEQRRRMISDVGLVVVDECHHAAADTYLAVLGHYGCIPTVERSEVTTDAVGFTATMVRGDDRALGAVWEDVVYRRSIAEMIHLGFLVRPRGVRVRIDDLDLSKVRRSRGDYSEGDLGRALTESLAPEVIAKAVAEHARDRRSILFAPTVASGQVIADAVRDVGLTVGMVQGDMPTEARRRILSDFSAGQIGLMVNCMVLTEGFDDPATDCVIIARPTTNVGLYVQMVGRALRPYPGKTDALVLDVVGASQRHALASPVDLFGDDPAERERAIAELDGLDDGDELDDGEIVADYVVGPTVSEEVDLFHGSVMQWLQTDGGIWFLPAGERYIAIVPSELAGHYDVVAMFKSRGQGEARWVIRNVADRAYAMAWAEGEVSPAEMTTARRERGWRFRPPTDKQLRFAQRLRVPFSLATTSGELSSMIETKLATSRIDPPTYDLLKRYGRMP
jgi:ATP-dependent helicase IRC3